MEVRFLGVRQSRQLAAARIGEQNVAPAVLPFHDREHTVGTPAMFRPAFSRSSGASNRMNRPMSGRTASNGSSKPSRPWRRISDRHITRVGEALLPMHLAMPYLCGKRPTSGADRLVEHVKAYTGASIARDAQSWKRHSFGTSLFRLRLSPRRRGDIFREPVEGMAAKGNKKTEKA
jgi:hypothetical protein